MTEDSKTGYRFFKYIAKKDCISAHGKSNIIGKLLDKTFTANDNVLVIADGAAFGVEFEKILKLQDILVKNIYFYFPESFEWLLLHSLKFEGYVQLQTVLQKPYNYIYSEKYFSWERYFEALLRDTCNKYHIAYNKDGDLAAIFTIQENVLHLLSYIKGGDFSKWRQNLMLLPTKYDI